MNEQELWDFITETAYMRFMGITFENTERGNLGELLWENIYVVALFADQGFITDVNSTGLTPKWHLLPQRVWEGLIAYNKEYASFYLCWM